MKLIAVAVALILLAVGAIAEDTMFNGESLTAGQFLENDPYKFIMQTDCNLVLYKTSKALWASGTNGKGTVCNTTLESNGNLVVSSNSGIVWSSNSARGPNNYRLIVQSDGNVVIYGAPQWATNTVQSSKKRLL